jgi:branched-chain amino acid transport system permease protein
MELLLQRVIDGLSNGAIYASVALAIVIVYKATRILNFAQGEMAMFATFIIYVLSVDQGLPIWGAVALGVLLAMAAGALIERGLIRPLESRSDLATVVVPLGLFILINDLAGGIWTYETRAFPALFPAGLDDYVEIGGARLRFETIGTWITFLAVFGLVFALLRFTKIGLAFRAVSSNLESSRLVGIPLGRTLMLGWALAGGIGALAGALTANATLLQPNMMLGILIYATAAAALGGFDSIGGALVGGILVGLTESLVVGYVGFIGAELRLTVAIVLLAAVLVIRPQGLFGTKTVQRI